MPLRSDRRVVGLAVVSLVLSTLTVLTIARERVDEPLQILRNDYPSVVEQGQKATFSFVVMAREGFEDVQFRFSILTQKVLRSEDLIDPKRQYQATDDPDEVLHNLVKISWLKNQTEILGIEPEKFNFTLQFQDTECRMVLWDYSSVLETLWGGELALNTAVLYAGVIDENGEDYYLEGESGFFFSLQDNIVSLSIARNTNLTGYLPDDEIRPESKLPVSRAPKGVLNYRAVEKDDTFTVVFTVEPEVYPAGFGSNPSPGSLDISVVQVIRAYLDGVLFDQPIVNIMEGG